MSSLFWRSLRPYDVSKPTVILLHPAWMDGRTYDETFSQIESLNGTVNKVNWITVDLNGHGGTIGKGRESFTMWDQADDLDELKISKSIIAGMSMGAMVSLRAGIRYPERISGLILLANRATPFSQPYKEAFEVVRNIWISTPTPSEEIMNASINAWGGNPDLNDERSKTVKERWIADHSGAERINNVYDSLVALDDVTDQLAGVTVPVLILHGTDDQTFAISEAEILKKGFVNAKSVQFLPIQGAGHLLVSMRKGEDVVARMEEFVATNAS